MVGLHKFVLKHDIIDYLFFQQLIQVIFQKIQNQDRELMFYRYQ